MQHAVPAVLIRSIDGRLVTLPVQPLTTPDARRDGYMDTPNYFSTPALLFIFPRPERTQFWMHRTHVPLDIVFVDEIGAVVAVRLNARPFDETPVGPDVPVLLVLEVPAGWAPQLGLTVGAQLRQTWLPQASSLR